jgi:hypothetical protein
LVIQLSSQQIACQEIVKIKQLQTRTNTVSGFSNFGFTLLYGIFFDDIKGYLSFLPVPEGQQKLRTSGKAVYNMVSELFKSGSKIECYDFGMQMGVFISEMLEAKTDNTVALIENLKN